MRILIADDHGIVRGGLKLLIDRQPDMEVVAEAEDGVAALESTQEHRPTVAVLDVSMPRMTGLQAAREIRAHAPDTRVLMLSMHDDERYFLEGLEAGAAGYVLKRAADKDLIDAVLGLCHDLHVGLALDQQPEAAANDAVVVGDQDPHVTPMVSSMVVPAPGSV